MRSTEVKPDTVAVVPEYTEVRTDRLTLTAMTAHDAEALFAILGDPAGWWFDPPARHTVLATTVGFCERAAARWSTDGLSYWTARLDGVVVGLGGAQRHRSGTWNISYRIGSAHQGRGLATELGAAGCRAASLVDPTVAIIAWVVEHNTASRRVAERLGLVDRGPRIDANDGQLRLAYSDRPLTDL